MNVKHLNVTRLLQACVTATRSCTETPNTPRAEGWMNVDAHHHLQDRKAVCANLWPLNRIHFTAVKTQTGESWAGLLLSKTESVIYPKICGNTLRWWNSAIFTCSFIARTSCTAGGLRHMSAAAFKRILKLGGKLFLDWQESSILMLLLVYQVEDVKFGISKVIHLR